MLLCCNLPLDISHRTLMSLMHVQFVLRYSDAVCLPVYFFVPLPSDMSGREGGFSEYLSARLESGSWSNEAADRIWVSAAADKDEEDLVGVLGVGGPLVSIKIIISKSYLGYLPVTNILRRHWFSCEMTSKEGRLRQKFHTDDASLDLIWGVLLVGRAAWEICFDQSEAPPRCVSWHVISMEVLPWFLRRHFAGKPLVSSRNVGCFFRLWTRKRVDLLQSPVRCSHPKAMTKVRYTYTCGDYLPWPAAFFSNCAV